MKGQPWQDSQDFGLGFGLATIIDYRDAKKLWDLLVSDISVINLKFGPNLGHVTS